MTSAPPHAGQVREGEAPSYFNAVEAAVLVELVEGLLASTQQPGVRGVRPDDLGVMATYRKQVGHASDTAALIMHGRGRRTSSTLRHLGCPWTPALKLPALQSSHDRGASAAEVPLAFNVRRHPSGAQQHARAADCQP